MYINMYKYSTYDIVYTIIYTIYIYMIYIVYKYSMNVLLKKLLIEIFLLNGLIKEHIFNDQVIHLI